MAAFRTTKHILIHALEHGYAVGAFNITNLESIQAAIMAAKTEQAPIILQTSEKAIGYAGLGQMVAMAREETKRTKVPVALHLDHGSGFAAAKACIGAGYSSVMIDASSLPFPDNVALTRRVSAYAHTKGISTEAELGRLVGVEDKVKVSERDAFMADPAKCREFVRRTRCDALAPAIGNVHGLYYGTPKLDFDRLREIRQKVTVPLVLHGASDLPASDIRKCVRDGIQKINIDTDIRIAFTEAVHSFFRRFPRVSHTRGSYDMRTILNLGREAMTATIRKKMRMFGASGKAKSATK
ncbi:class II fructose-bisphosphate aldolase [Candidatus Woesearchaeota archaeon]|nr:class II fructose-bisphosphate aldolase [Candidatus Woesearchaeota archaeon]